jgi:hypothetical protein
VKVPSSSANIVNLVNMYSYFFVILYCTIRNKVFYALPRGRLPKKIVVDFWERAGTGKVLVQYTTV